MEFSTLFDRNAFLANEIYKLLRSQNKSVSSAESCTGGLLATFLTEIPGSSTVYKGGISCYSNESKTKILDIPVSTFETVGAVSKEVAHGLAKNVQSLFESDFGLSITGIAGPDGGTPQKPVGTVWCAIYGKNVENVWKLSLKGTRQMIRMHSSESVLKEFLELLKKG